MKFLYSIIFLGIVFFKILLKRFFIRRDEESILRSEFEPEGIFSIENNARDGYASFSRCINCGLCGISFSPENSLWDDPRFLIDVISRNLYDTNQKCYQRNLALWQESSEFLCPVGVPFDKIIEFVGLAKKR
ncbi:MAG TPA: hypothetical protein VII00_04085 [bacterium]